MRQRTAWRTLLRKELCVCVVLRFIVSLKATRGEAEFPRKGNAADVVESRIAV